MSRGRPAKCGHIAVTCDRGSTRIGPDTTTADFAKPRSGGVTNCSGPARMLIFGLSRDCVSPLECRPYDMPRAAQAGTEVQPSDGIRMMPA